MRTCWSIFKILLGAAAAVSAAFSRSSTPPLQPQQWWLDASICLAVVLAVVIAADAAIDIILEQRRRKSEKVKKEIEWFLLGALKTLGKNIGIDPVLLGASVFEARKSWEIQRSAWNFSRKLRLHHYVRYRLDAYPPPSGIKWKAGRGAIGRALEQRATVHCDWVGISNLLTKEPHASLPAGTDMWGMDEHEFRKMAGHYYESLATPILEQTGGKLLGILAIDLPNRESLSQQSAVLGAPDVEEALAVPTAKSIALRWTNS